MSWPIMDWQTEQGLSKVVRDGVSSALEERDKRQRRERIARDCLKGLLAGPRFGDLNQVLLARQAVIQADALIAELDKTEGG